MRTLFLFAVATVFFFTACLKEKPQKTPISGVWVESSLRLDTLDFEAQHRMGFSGEYPLVLFRTNTYTDTVLNPLFPVNHNEQYSYYFTGNKKQIWLRGMLSSSTAFNTYTCLFSSDNQQLLVARFYARRSLPGVVEFVRIR